MRYTDEGNLRFSGNTRTSSPNQGYYRSELNSGKYAVTLTNTEPGLGYLGFNADELTYDIDNHTLCTCNLELCGGICGNLNVSGNVTSGGYLCSCGELYVSDSIYGESDLSLSGGLCLGAPGDVCIYDQCGHDIFCSYNGDLCIYGLGYSDEAYTSNNSCIEMEHDAIRICRRTNDGNFGISICTIDDCITFTGKPSTEAIKFIDGKTIHTTASCLKLDNDVCVPDIFTMGSGSSTKCHYIHTVSLNNSTYTSTDGTINLGNTTGLDNNFSLVVSNCTYSTAPVQSVVIGYNTNIHENITLTNSVLIGNAACATLSANQDVVAIGNNAAVCGQDTVAIGASSRANGFGATAIGSGSCADSGTFAIGESAKSIYLDKIYVSTLKNGPFNKSMVAIGNLVKQCDMYDMINKLYICSCHTSISLSDAQCRFGISGTGRVKTNSGYFADLDISCQWVTISCDYAVWENVGTFYKGCTDTWQPPYSDVCYIFTEFCY